MKVRIFVENGVRKTFLFFVFLVLMLSLQGFAGSYIVTTHNIKIEL